MEDLRREFRLIPRVPRAARAARPVPAKRVPRRSNRDKINELLSVAASTLGRANTRVDKLVGRAQTLAKNAAEALPIQEFMDSTMNADTVVVAGAGSHSGVEAESETCAAAQRADHRLEELQAECTGIQKKLLDEINGLKEQLARADKKDKSAARCSDSVHALGIAQAEIARLRALLRSATQQNRSLEKSLSEYADESGECATKLDKSQRECVQRTRAIGGNRDRLETLAEETKRQLEVAATENARLEQQVADLRKQNARLVTEMKQGERAHEDAERVLRQAVLREKAKRTDQKREVEETKEELLAAQQTIEELQVKRGVEDALLSHLKPASGNGDRETMRENLRFVLEGLDEVTSSILTALREGERADRSAAGSVE